MDGPAGGRAVEQRLQLAVRDGDRLVVA